MRFDVTDLRLFLNIHEAGTITDGAQRSHITLASASERVKGMEEAIGVALLLRGRRGVQLTPAGRTLLHHARSVLQQVDRMRGELDLYGQGLKGHVRLLCNTAALSEYLPDILGGFLAQYPQISVDLEERMSYDIADAIRSGIADIGIVADSVDLQGLETHTFLSDPLTLIVPMNHELAQRKSVSFAEVIHHDFIGLTEGSALQEHIAHHARKAGKHLGYRIRLRSLDATCRMVGQGIGIGIVPKATATRLARTARIKQIPLADTWARRDLVLCVRPANELPVYVRQMMNFILSAH
ncbi:LysR family transcriptional regulator [Pollutimonas harenae]|uniref:LysR family transcriptional regulator n=1 Tax=Pollutimonas harenae TaxID=657015 RepID=A0A853GW41_9BURK|nr:LysR family transcriptional regulator [Pollutimonas harenae]NYT86551.1 LysR family transcriptional regulator [Pollutimonas harenae]TEA69707.1 LysR family transcriptional regulator [Pollutimonas harenae]